MTVAKFGGEHVVAENAAEPNRRKINFLQTGAGRSINANVAGQH
jgi:hypothetical protein